MSTDRWARLEELYHAVRGRPVAEQAAYLAEACADDAALRQEVQSLLAGAPATDAAVTTTVSTAATLVPGATLSHYRIESRLGAGGMGEVFRARDTRLNRSVAIKVSRAAFTLRFRREAQALASLSHPHICTLYDVGADYLVMELVEGETLEQRLMRGPLQEREVMRLGAQVADALTHAHEKGITHRDLKPGNVMLTGNGVKVLDFGLATLGNQTTTLTAPGVVMGTPAYMAPEQREGRDAGPQTDLYAFGLLLNAMATGRRLVVRPGEDPALPGLRAVLAHVVGRCLAEEPAARWRSAAEVHALLEFGANASGGLNVDASHRSAESTKWSRRQAIVGVTSAAAFGAVASAAGTWWLMPPASRDRLRYVFTAPPGTRIAVPSSYGAVVSAGVLSPDGSKLAFVASDASNAFSIYIYHRDSLAEATPLAGTEGAAFPFWAPEGDRLGFFSGGELRVANLQGGGARTLCLAPRPGGGTWSRNHDIVFAGAAPKGSALFRVGDPGGDPRPIVSFPNDISSGRFPHFLPDGEHFLYYVSAWAEPDVQGVYVGALDTAREPARLNVDADSAAVYANGYLLFGRSGALYTQPFDVSSRTPRGSVVRVIDSIPKGFADRGAPPFSASNTRVLAYRPGLLPHEVQLTWYDRKGAPLQKVGPPGAYIGVDVGRDGRIAVHRHDEKGGVVFVIELDGAITPITTDPAEEGSSPIFSPDARRLAFAAKRGKKWGLFLKDSNGTGAAELLYESDRPLAPMGWYADTLLVWTQNWETSQDVFQISTRAPGKPTALLNSPAVETHAQVPDGGNWMTYLSTRGGAANIYVQALTPGAAPVLVSPGGGVSPRVRRDGTEVFYLPGFQDGRVRSVSVQVQGNRFIIGPPRELFNAPIFSAAHDANSHAFAVSADGTRFLVPVPLQQADDKTAAQVVIVDNWNP